MILATEVMRAILKPICKLRLCSHFGVGIEASGIQRFN